MIYFKSVPTGSWAKKNWPEIFFLNKWSEMAGRFGQITFLKPYDPPEGVSFVQKNGEKFHIKMVFVARKFVRSLL